MNISGIGQRPAESIQSLYNRIKELEDAIKAHKLAVEDRIKINDVQPIVFGGAHLALWSVLDNK